MAMVKRSKNIPLIRIITLTTTILMVSLPALHSQKLAATNWVHHSIDSLLPGSSWGTSGFTLADFDKDGDLDITISRREISNGKVYWYENKSGTWISHDLGISDEDQLGATVSYINNDGYPDLVVGRYWFENPSVLNHFPDSLWIRRSYAGGLPRENHDIAAYDFDRDGKEEILCYSQKAGGGTLRLYKTNNPENWSYLDISDSVNSTVSDIPGNNGIHGGFSPGGIGDLDGDNFADIVMPAGWFKNPGNTFGGVWTYKPWPFHEGIVPNLYGISGRSWVADIDSNGDQDVVFVDCDVEGSKGYLFINEGKGRPFKRVALPSPGEPTGSYHSLAVADFDNDGDLDIFTGEQEDPSKGMKPAFLQPRGFFWENTGSSRQPTFVVRIIHIGNPGWHDVQIGDVDDDVDIDIVSKIWFKDGKYYHADYWENRIKKY
jgi:hypothetical protein